MIKKLSKLIDRQDVLSKLINVFAKNVIKIFKNEKTNRV